MGSDSSFEIVMKFLNSYLVDIDEFLRETGYLSPNVKPEIVKECGCYCHGVPCVGFKIRELPVAMYERNNGISMHRGLRPVYYIFKVILSIFMTMLRKRPMPLNSHQ